MGAIISALPDPRFKTMQTDKGVRLESFVADQRLLFSYRLWRMKMGKRIRKFRTIFYPSTSAAFASQLCENTFQTIPVVSIFGQPKSVSAKFFGLEDRFPIFGPILEDLHKNGPQNTYLQTSSCVNFLN